jgi:hypothetical protein
MGDRQPFTAHLPCAHVCLCATTKNDATLIPWSTTVNTLNDLDSSQQARAFSAQLGELAAAAPATTSPLDLGQSGSPTPSRLSDALTRILRRSVPPQHVANKLKVNEFLTGE